MVVAPVLAVSLGVLVLIFILRTWNKSLKSVPGSMGWPIIGHLPYLLPAKLRGFMKKMTDKHGTIFRLKLGSWNSIVFTDYHQIKKVFHNAEFSFRPSIYLFELVGHGNHGLSTANGELWQEQRRFALRHLRDLGMGRSSIESHIQREALDVMESLKKNVGQPIDLNFTLNIAITNIVWAIVAGKRMAHDDPVFLGFMLAIRRNMELAGTMGILGFIPWLKDILPGTWLGVDLVEESVGKLENHFKEIIKQHKETFDPNDLRDYTDHFINEQRRQGEEKSTFTDLQLMVSIGDLFVAGGETTSTTLRWAVLLLSYHPDVQKKMQEEIDLIVGRERLPTLDDREMMPYTDAVINEVHRFADIAPLSLFHGNKTDVEFEGYKIPKDSMIIGYIGGCHRSPQFWAKPNEFYPEHFLDKEGKLRHNVEGFLPFSTGKRQCIGESLARFEMFIFITYLFQSFNFTLCQNPKPSLKGDPKSGLVLWPQSFKVVLENRGFFYDTRSFNF